MSDYNLDDVLMEIPGSGGLDAFTIRDAVEGVQIFGGIGSGKTSGSGRMLALKYLDAGFGGLVLTTKIEERRMWEEYCHEALRYDDLIIIEPGGKHRFNFIEYETVGRNKNAATSNIVQMLKTVIQAGEERGGVSGKDPFWETALDMLIFNTIDLCFLAYGKVTIELMYQIVLSAPKKDEVKREEAKKDDTKKEAPKPPEPKLTAYLKATKAAQRAVNWQVEQWRKKLSQAERKTLNSKELVEAAIMEAIPDARLLHYVDQFFSDTFWNLSEKTKSVVSFSFSGFLYRLLREPLYSLFCRYSSTVSPEDCLDGKIILLDLPVKEYHKFGQDNQILLKYIWQRAMEKRDVRENGRPVFLWADESQNFLHPYDSAYQATARSSRIATVYISQNLPNYNASMPGESSEHRVKSLLGTFGTKFFHSNGDHTTNTYGSELFGEGYSEDISRTTTRVGDNFSVTETTSFKLEKLVRPERFAGLLTGGPENDLIVEGYMHRQSRLFPEGLSHRLLRFKQDYHLSH